MAVKLATWQPCIVTWEDAVHLAGEQHESVAAGLSSYKPYFRKSIGFYVGRAEKDGRACVVLATDDDRSAESPDGVGGLFYVPAAMVVKIEPAIPPKRK
jgi:hypothetical protein